MILDSNFWSMCGVGGGFLTLYLAQQRAILTKIDERFAHNEEIIQGIAVSCAGCKAHMQTEIDALRADGGRIEKRLERWEDERRPRKD